MDFFQERSKNLIGGSRACSLTHTPEPRRNVGLTYPRTPWSTSGQLLCWTLQGQSSKSIINPVSALLVGVFPEVLCIFATMHYLHTYVYRVQALSIILNLLADFLFKRVIGLSQLKPIIVGYPSQTLH